MGQDAAVTDGRRARGIRRRAEIIEATLGVVLRHGAAGVTHREVAAQADIPTSLITYYFPTLDDLLVAALTSVADTYSERLSGILDSTEDTLRGLAELIAESAGTGRVLALAERELSTMAARRPALRPVARRWRENVADIARTYTADAELIEVFVAVTDGLCVAALLGEGTSDPEHLYTVLLRCLETG